jgi:hypothetical protein
MNRVQGFLGYLGFRTSSVVLTAYRSSLPSQKLVVLRIEANVVFLDVRVKVISAQYLGDFDELVVVVVTMEKGLLAEDLQMPRKQCLKGVLHMSSLTIDANMQP